MSPAIVVMSVPVSLAMWRERWCASEYQFIPVWTSSSVAACQWSTMFLILMGCRRFQRSPSSLSLAVLALCASYSSGVIWWTGFSALACLLAEWKWLSPTITPG